MNLDSLLMCKIHLISNFVKIVRTVLECVYIYTILTRLIINGDMLRRFKGQRL